MVKIYIPFVHFTLDSCTKYLIYFRITSNAIPVDKIYPFFSIPKQPSVLWNAMIHPFLNMTIYGTIWYQGKYLNFLNLYFGSIITKTT